MTSIAAVQAPSFRAVVRAEILFNTKRVLPYALMTLFAGNALLWWARGPATFYGWATNSEFYIARLFGGFSFMTLPLFTAIMMADPVNRDFELGIDPLIFTKPLRRIQYLAGKFLGNYVVLLACQAVFALTLMLLQAFHVSGMVVQPARLLPYIEHFIMLIMVSQLTLAAIYFAVGTITRSARSVYALGVAFYFVYAGWQILVLRGMAPRWRALLDPLMMNYLGDLSRGLDAAALNQLSISYDAGMLANRATMVIAAMLALASLYWVFARRELVPAARERNVIAGLEIDAAAARARALKVADDVDAPLVAIPKAAVALDGAGARLGQLAAMFGAEIRLLRAERGVLMLLPLAVLLIAMNVTAFDIVPDVHLSGGYARRSAEALWLLLLGVSVFYSGALIHRERELGMDALVWSAPVSNRILLISKYLAVLALAHAVIGVTFLTAIAVQLISGDMPFQPGAYLVVYGRVLLPGLLFLIAASFLLNTVIREKLVAYAVSIGLASTLFYLYGQGINHWTYNPLRFQLWTYESLTNQSTALQSIYVVALTAFCFVGAVRLFSNGHRRDR